MDGLGDQLLAGAAFPGDQHGGVGVGDALHDAQHLLQQRAAADDVLEGEAVVERPAQMFVLVFQLFFLDHPVDLVPQLDVVEGFLQVVQRTQLDGLDGRLDGAEGGQKNDPHLRVIRFQFLEDLQARAAGDHLVHDHHVHVGRMAGLGLRLVLGDEQLVFGLQEYALEYVVNDDLVIDQVDDLFFHRVMLLSGLCSGKLMMKVVPRSILLCTSMLP
jgi:hypothetical protein